MSLSDFGGGLRGWCKGYLSTTTTTEDNDAVGTEPTGSATNNGLLCPGVAPSGGWGGAKIAALWVSLEGKRSDQEKGEQERTRRKGGKLAFREGGGGHTQQPRRLLFPGAFLNDVRAGV